MDDGLWQDILGLGRELLVLRDDPSPDIASLAARLGSLIGILVVRGELLPGHAEWMQKLGESAASSATRTRVKLRVIDKYEVKGPDIDCASLIPLCQARCCSMKVELSEQDMHEGGIAWDLHEPYIMRREADGYCTYIDGKCGCTMYERRPAVCRSYDCRQDERVWIDFEKRIPAPARPFPLNRPER